jgi:hypothetical protein
MAQPLRYDMHGLALIEQPCTMRHPQVVQANVETENFHGALRELLRNRIGMPRLMGLTTRGREDQPIIW